MKCSALIIGPTPAPAGPHEQGVAADVDDRAAQPEQHEEDDEHRQRARHRDDEERDGCPDERPGHEPMAEAEVVPPAAQNGPGQVPERLRAEQHADRRRANADLVTQRREHRTEEGERQPEDHEAGEIGEARVATGGAPGPKCVGAGHARHPTRDVVGGESPLSGLDHAAGEAAAGCAASVTTC